MENKSHVTIEEQKRLPAGDGRAWAGLLPAQLWDRGREELSSASCAVFLREEEALSQKGRCLYSSEKLLI